MFTGIVAAIGVVDEICPASGIDGALDCNLSVKVPAAFADGISIGASVLCSGCCLSVTEVVGDSLRFYISHETISRTHFGQLKEGSFLNLEKGIRAGDRFDGHIVSGHVDCLCSIISMDSVGEGVCLVVKPYSGLRYIVDKGSVALDGVSLTVSSVSDSEGMFSVALIPETIRCTTLQYQRAGGVVNLEYDQLAKYTENAVRYAARMSK